LNREKKEVSSLKWGGAQKKKGDKRISTYGVPTVKKGAGPVLRSSKKKATCPPRKENAPKGRGKGGEKFRAGLKTFSTTKKKKKKKVLPIF